MRAMGHRRQTAPPRRLSRAAPCRPSDARPRRRRGVSRRRRRIRLHACLQTAARRADGAARCSLCRRMRRLPHRLSPEPASRGVLAGALRQPRRPFRRGTPRCRPRPWRSSRPMSPPTRRRTSTHCPPNAFRRTAADAPYQITATRFWKWMHAGISDAVFKSPAPVGARGNCAACHRDAATGRFDPRRIDIPQEITR